MRGNLLRRAFDSTAGPPRTVTEASGALEAIAPVATESEKTINYSSAGRGVCVD